MPPIICNINNAIQPIRKSQKCLLKSFCVCVFIRTFHCYYPHACVDSWLVRELRDPATQIHLCGGLWQIARRIESKRIEFDLTTASAHKTTIADHFLIKSLNLITTCLRNEWPYRMPLTWVVVWEGGNVRRVEYNLEKGLRTGHWSTGSQVVPVLFLPKIFPVLMNAKWIMSNCVNATGLLPWRNAITRLSTGPSLYFLFLTFL